jgi:hypothetical protein
MELDKLKEDKSIKGFLDDVLDVSADALSIVGSPTTLWLMVLWNCNGGKGFSGYITNPDTWSKLGLLAPTVPPPPASSPTGPSGRPWTLLGSYKGWNIYQNPDGTYFGLAPNSSDVTTPALPSIAAVKNWIDQHR